MLVGVKAGLPVGIGFKVAWYFGVATGFGFLELFFLFNVGESDDFYGWFFGPRMTYTSGIISDIEKEETLEQLQDSKLAIVCEKIGLQAGEKMLDIGCGWGILARFASDNYGAHVTGITLGWVIDKLDGSDFEIKHVDTVGVHYSATLWRWYRKWIGNCDKVEAKCGKRWYRVSSLTKVAPLATRLLNINSTHRVEGIDSQFNLSGALKNFKGDLKAWAAKNNVASSTDFLG
ncbi:hypothetical protein QQS21_010482 [Conoideocrella luteorostrata]|uniref:sphingolipid C(9)-methyltransferase n=1 Tax=Conoideocrella luteorostrata TaxID=1105319 RepID=A0AAJ0CHN1_9HYPO|nr:hypothetical protein QQS21_010482 [Conoideocrella luteorostrata]